MTKMSFAIHRFVFIPWVIIAAALLQTFVWAIDRKPPFEVLRGGVTSEAIPGRPIRIEGDVIRDTSRDCSAHIHHWIEDRLGFRTYFNDIHITAEAIKRINEISPNKTKYFVDLPQSIRPGQATYNSVLLYKCNPVHSLWPIEVYFRTDFEVLEAAK